MHNTGRIGDEDPYRQRETAETAAWRDGALYLRPSAGLPDLLRKWQLRTPGHGRRGRAARGTLRLRWQEPPCHGGGWIEPDFNFDPSKCIVCSRCVRACEEVQ